MIDDAFDGGVAVLDSFINGRVIIYVGGGTNLTSNSWKSASGTSFISIRTIQDGVSPANYPRKYIKPW